MRCFAMVVLVAAVGFSTSAEAKPWVTDYSVSHIGFTGKQGGEVFEGGFKKFEASIDFDMAHPETSKISVSIDIASAYAGSSDRDTYLPQSDWFNTAKFPKAEFVTTAIKPGQSSCYEASGTLTIKGITKPVTLPFCLKQEGDHMRAHGELTLQRNEFSVGVGQWAGEGTVANLVVVSVEIVAR